MAKKRKKLRISILKRIALLFTISLILSSLLTVGIQYIYSLNEVQKQGTATAGIVGSTVKTALDYEGSIDALQEDEQYRVRIHDTLRHLCLGFGLRFISLYTIDKELNRHYIIIAANNQDDDARMNEDYGYESGNIYSVPLHNAEKNVLNGTSKQDFELISNQYGDIYLHISPITDQDDDIVALIGVGVDIDSIMKLAYEYLIHTFAQEMFVIGLTFLIALMLIRKMVIRPIKTLSWKMKHFVKDRDAEIYSPGRKTFFEDEVTDIEASFDEMAVDISEYVNDIEKLTMEKVQVGTQLDIARKIQCGIVPFEHGLSGNGYEVFGYEHPAREVGGDFYDIFNLDKDNVCIVVGDSSGKGISAALFMVMVKTTIRENLRMGSSLSETLNFVNGEICMANPENMFATVLAAKLNTKTGILTLANAGHTPPILLGRVPSYIDVDTGMALGIFDDADIKEEEITLKDGEGVLIYTDGVTETLNTEKVQYGERKLVEIIKKNYQQDGFSGAHILVHSIVDSVKRFSEGLEQFDDITCTAAIYKNNEMNSNYLTPEMESFKTVKQTILTSLGENEISRKILLACEEIFSNIVNYSEAGNVSFSCERIGNIYSVTFFDDGIPFDPVKTSVNKKEFEELDKGGIGLMMARKNSKEMIYNRIEDRNILTLKFDVTPLTEDYE
ncbi:ATP-binding SpoIIE family protein phosphatase [Oribacterium sp. WCC10]|uniref:ATP-binding SpoIIE family protein phosphatase n=1 Tax=Oribacterium sp. WCC10 TaxID=1855343 RepID=UPI0008E7C75F|nr:SpoIIE family protein phosphatase [Oribacterium sp. WCC10]SFG45428.1 Serine phosphatase RsbU, regulator of sigma subunit [Oribacterium sp. WCC10]